MAIEALSVIHVDTGKEWRGGQQQAAYLHQRLIAMNIASLMICPPGVPMSAFCEREKLPYAEVRMHSELDFRAALRIARLAKNRGAGILQLHTSHALTLGLLAKCFYRSVKLIAVRRVDFHVGRNYLSRQKYRHRFLDKIVCISQRIRDILIECGLPKSRLTVIRSGVDTHKFDDVSVPANFREQNGIPPDSIVIGTVAALVGHKDYPTLLRAAAIVLKNRRDVVFCAVGDGGKSLEIEAMARELGLGERFIFTGRREDVGMFLKSYDIFVLSSKKEGLGTSVLDAQAVGLPVVACAAGGIPEMIRDGWNGLLVPKEAPADLARALLKLVSQPELRRRLGAQARDSVRDFDIEKTVEGNLALYREILA